jgi:hypothetical protein
MTIASNSYAEKVFAEHPIGLWSLDEQADYVSLISKDLRNLIHSPTSWNITGATGSLLTDNSISKVIQDAVINKLNAEDGSEGQTKTILMVSPSLVDFSEVDKTKDIFTIGTYLYPYSKKVNVKIGYSCTKTATQTIETVTKDFYVDTTDSWSFISESFSTPQDFEDLKIIIEVTHVVEKANEDYSFLIHAQTIGQWSEPFNMSSLGITLEQLPLNLAVAGYGTPALAYGLQDKDGYYMSYNNSLCATNSDMPLVYGASYSTKLTPNGQGEPSLIVPGLGFMCDDGQYTDLTFETWIKIQTLATEPKRILGPVGSDDGLYVDGPFLLLKVGQYQGSHFMTEWDRPMLIAIRLSSASASLVINGDEVISLTLDPENVKFPDKVIGGKNQDLIGFYAYDDVPVINIDSVGIYPYIVPALVEKRRWVYGQAVDIKENIAGSDISTTVAIDYPFAKYSKNYIYPDIGRFEQGINENLLISNNEIKLPEYSLPEFVFSNKTGKDWYSSVKSVNSAFGPVINLRPNDSWSDTDGYILFESINLLSQDLKAFYLLVETNLIESGQTVNKECLFSIENDITGDRLIVTQTGNKTSYVFEQLTLAGEIKSEVIYSDSYHNPGDFLFVGIKFDSFIDSFGGKLSQFFGSKQSLRLYVGGTKEFENTFTGNIYRVGFTTSRNLSKISTVFTRDGIAVGYNDLEGENPNDAGKAYFGNSYIQELMPVNNANSIPVVLLKSGDVWYKPSTEEYRVYGSSSWSIATKNIPAGFWEQLADGGEEYFGNLNTSYDQILDGGGVYSILVSKVLNHIASYTLIPKILLGEYFLDIGVNGYWQDYVPLSYFGKYVAEGTNSKKFDLDFIQFNIAYPTKNKYIGGKYDTSNESVKTYVSFQDLKEKITIRPDSFENVIGAPQNGVVDAEGYLNSPNTKYEVVNDSIIYAPRGDSNLKSLAMVLHVEILSDGILEHPVKIKNIQLASQALNAFKANAIGTRYGTDIYPYRRSGEYFDYKGKSPFSIYKGSTPYLYLTSNSGIRLRGFDIEDTSRGLSIPINQGAADYYKIAAMQFSFRLDGEEFPSELTEIAEIVSVSIESQETIRRYTKLYMIADGPRKERGVIYAVDRYTGLLDNNIMFYVNGRPVKTPIINLKSWMTLGMVFNTPIGFNKNVGALRITGSILFNNIFQYQITKLDEESRTIYRKWSAVSRIDALAEHWRYWADGISKRPNVEPVDPFSWRTVLFLSSKAPPIFDGETIYQKYTGTDRVIVDSGSSLKLNNYSYLFYKDVTWKSSVSIST